MADQLIRATAAQGRVQAMGVISTRLVEEARGRHGLSSVATAALGRTMTAGLLLSCNLKAESARVNIRVLGDGPLGGIFVDAGADGTVRGYVKNPTLELPPTPQGKLDVGGAVGDTGFLHVVKDLGYGKPYSGTVELVSGEIGEDITHYLASSEQTASAVLLGVFVSAQGVEASGGILLQLMPDPEHEQLAQWLDDRLQGVQGITTYLRSGKDLTQILQEILGEKDLEVFPETQLVRFACGCSVERVLGAIKMLGTAELQDMIEKDHGAEATCHFCNEQYRLSVAQLTTLIAAIEQEARLSAP
ncbi:Hsp33 family molecular chaperone HslO [Candidatus Cyanaurora vandensis]|uniref:Hsp33 family molecular chaperone HslO n=1 Tax=Candidatus Cyanaurora vandensis TaxID=2714958 RepID=UPI00257B464C|nr:Hsp33 family molecular chaperone HslO [Candidatus Cyanaurora vandensis]